MKTPAGERVVEQLAPGLLPLPVGGQLDEHDRGVMVALEMRVVDDSPEARDEPGLLNVAGVLRNQRFPF